MSRRRREWEAEDRFFDWLRDTREGRIFDVLAGGTLMLMFGFPAFLLAYALLWAVGEALGLELPCWFIEIGRCR